MVLFRIMRGLEMILSHMALSCLNMSLYRTIWIHFRTYFMIFIINKILDLVLELVQILDLVQDLAGGLRARGRQVREGGGGYGQEAGVGRWRVRAGSEKEFP